MHYKNLGNSSLKVSSYCLGTMTFGETTDETDAHLQINDTLFNGINFISMFVIFSICSISALSPFFFASIDTEL